MALTCERIEENYFYDYCSLLLECRLSSVNICNIFLWLCNCRWHTDRKRATSLNQSIKSVLSSLAIRSESGQWTGKTQISIESFLIFIYLWFSPLSLAHAPKEGNCEWSPKHFFSFLFSPVTIHAIFHFATNIREKKLWTETAEVKECPYVCDTFESEIPHSFPGVVLVPSLKSFV